MPPRGTIRPLSWTRPRADPCAAPAVECLLRDLTGVEAALVFSSPAAALLATLAALAGGREVIVSRGQLVEIGDGCPVTEIFARSGVVLREVGTTSQTRLQDYAAAIGERTAALLLIDADDFTITGRTVSVALEELRSLGSQRQVPVIHDTGLGPLVDPAPFGLAWPFWTPGLHARSDLVLARGDGLVGGPQVRNDPRPEDAR